MQAGDPSMATMKSCRMTLTSPIIFYFTNTFMVITAGVLGHLIKPGGPDLLLNFYSQENNRKSSRKISGDFFINCFMIYKLLQRDADYIALFLRVIAGIIIFPYGMQKLLGWFDNLGGGEMHLSFN